MDADPVKVGLIFLGAACTSLGFGAAILYFAWIGFRNGSYPLTASRDLTGALAKVAAVLIGLFGLLVVTCGVVTLVFGFLRVRQLM